MKNILLTGSNGFIGRNVLEQLGQSHNFFSPSHNELDLLDKSNTREYLTTNKIDVVIHAAGAGVSRGQAGDGNILERNEQMFLSLAENSNLFGRLIFLGSGAEYGKQNFLVKVKESDFGTVLPADDYGKSKYFASQQIAKMDNAVNLRCFGVFGKYEDYTTRFISNAICRSLCGLPIALRQNTLFDYLYVKDIIAVINYFITHEPKEKFYNVGSGDRAELLTLAEIIHSQTESKSEILVKSPGLGKEYTCNNTLLKTELGDNFKITPLPTAVAEMVSWYRENFNMIDKNKLNFDA